MFKSMMEGLVHFLSTHAWVTLFIAIFAEVIATSMLKASDGFKHLFPTLVVLVGYLVAFFCLSLTLRQIPLGIAYAVWSGVGTATIVAIGVIAYGQKPDMAAILGIFLIVSGVLVLNLLSKSSVA